MSILTKHLSRLHHGRYVVIVWCLLEVQAFVSCIFSFILEEFIAIQMHFKWVQPDTISHTPVFFRNIMSPLRHSNIKIVWTDRHILRYLCFVFKTKQNDCDFYWATLFNLFVISVFKFKTNLINACKRFAYVLPVSEWWLVAWLINSGITRVGLGTIVRPFQYMFHCLNTGSLLIHWESIVLLTFTFCLGQALWN